MDELVNLMRKVLADSFAFYLKAHNFHWNVEGVHFKELHDLFGGIYEEVYGSIDTFAEQIRSQGTYVPASFQRFSMLTQIDDEVEILPILPTVSIALPALLLSITAVSCAKG